MSHYNISKIWRGLNAKKPAVREKAETQAASADAEMSRAFEDIKGVLPYDFVEAYEQSSGFHDCPIRSILYENTGRETDVMIGIDVHGKIGTIVFERVGRFCTSITDLNCCVMGVLAWGYCDICSLENSSIQFDIQCDIRNKIEVRCKTVRFFWSA